MAELKFSDRFNLLIRYIFKATTYHVNAKLKCLLLCLTIQVPGRAL